MEVPWTSGSSDSEHWRAVSATIASQLTAMGLLTWESAQHLCISMLVNTVLRKAQIKAPHVNEALLCFSCVE